MSNVSSGGCERVPTCPQCNSAMVIVAHIDSFGNQPGLDAYECRQCGHIVSRLTDMKGDR